jgi:cytochrome c biogenesis protein CcmG, thiol:disulfide interchange protein DsbE
VFSSELSKLPNRAVCLAATVVALGLTACGSSGDDASTTAGTPDYQQALAGAPNPLAKLYAHGDRLVSGGTGAFDSQLAALRGHPVVVNVWASWCEPCRKEFPYLQRLSAKYGKRVAFVGVDTKDDDAAARTFLGEFPLPYPSYTDPNQDIARSVGATVGLPDTAYFDADGKRVFVKQGQYASESAFAADIERYALGG